MRSVSWVTFGLISLLILLGSLVHLKTVYPLYADAALRLRVQEILALTAEQKGFLLSGMEITSITSESLLLRYRDYQRGPDHTTCYDVSLTSSTSTETPCTND